MQSASIVWTTSLKHYGTRFMLQPAKGMSPRQVHLWAARIWAIPPGNFAPFLWRRGASSDIGHACYLQACALPCSADISPGAKSDASICGLQSLVNMISCLLLVLGVQQAVHDARPAHSKKW
eukprot:6334795-Amphidinium_carterae.1